MLKLIIFLECNVEDEHEAKSKFKAVRDVVSVFPFFKAIAKVQAQIQIPEKEGKIP